jgi:hypothetical protein
LHAILSHTWTDSEDSLMSIDGRGFDWRIKLIEAESRQTTVVDQNR